MYVISPFWHVFSNVSSGCDFAKKEQNENNTKEFQRFLLMLWRYALPREHVHCYLDNAKLRNCIFPFRNTCDKERETVSLHKIK
jgi:hypothetical protein